MSFVGGPARFWDKMETGNYQWAIIKAIKEQADMLRGLKGAFAHSRLTHWGLVTPFGVLKKSISQYWFGQCHTNDKASEPR